MAHVVLKATYFASFSAIVALSACSAMNSESIVAKRPNPATATLVIHWPSAQQETNARRRSAISPSAASITIAVNGGAPTVVNNPTLTGSPSTTSVTVDAPVGVDSFTFLAWDRAGGVGNILDRATTSQTIVADANNLVGVTLDGVCAALSSVATAGPFVQTVLTAIPISNGGTQNVMTSLRLDGPFTETVTVNQLDPDGNTIVNSGGSVPIVLNESGSTPHVTIAPVAPTAGNNAFTLTPLVAEPDGVSTTITATSPDCGSGTATIGNSFTLSTSALVYVADQSAGILAYDQDGNELTKISTTTGVTGLTYNATIPALIAVEPKSATSGGVAFQTLSLTGTALGSGVLPLPSGLTNPVGNVAYNAANGYVLVGFREYTDTSSNVHYGSVLEYTISGSTGTAIKPTGTNPFQTSSSTPPPYDVDSFAIYPNGNVLVGDSQATAYIYDKNGNFLNNEAYGASTTLAFDSLRGNVFDFFVSGNNGYALNSSLDDAATFNYPVGQGTYEVTAAAYNPATDTLYAFGGKTSFALSGTSIYANSTYSPNILTPGAFPGLTSPTEALVLQ